MANWNKGMKMDCDTYREQMSLWLDNRLTQDEIRQIETHTATCASCRVALSAWQRVDRLLTSVPMASPAPGFTTRFQARLATQRRRRHTWAGLAILGLATLGLFMGVATLLALSGLAFWESLSASGVLTQGIGLLLDLGKAMAVFFELAWVILDALAQGARHPVFIAFALATAFLVVAWTQIVTRRTFVHHPLRS
jgi:predicted anti-sigma-YlaC factor YlaD